MSDCYYDDAGCLVCPEQAAQPFVPSRVEQRAVLGWNAGANSVDTVDGGLHTVFNMPLGVVGAIIGLKGGRAQQTVPAQIEHGWYFQKRGSLDVVQPIERGIPVGSLLTGRTADTVFEIRRAGTQVRYFMGGQLIHVSVLPSIGAKVVNCCLYASGDEAPGGSGPTPTSYPAVLVAGVPFIMDDGLKAGAYVDDRPANKKYYWTLTVPSGATHITLVLSGETASMAAADSADAFIYGMTGPSAVPLVNTDWDAAFDANQWLSRLADLPAGATTAWQLDVSSPAIGTWYFAADTTVAGSFTLTATIT